MATTPMDLVASQQKQAHNQAIGLPTPSSLPASSAGRFPLESDSDEVETINSAAESDRNEAGEDVDAGEQFELEREGEIAGASGEITVSQSSESEVEPVAFSSHSTLIRRPFRARYQAMDEDSTTTTTLPSTIHPLDIDIVPSFKRSFEEATRTAQSPQEQPPPADDDTSSIASTSTAPPSRFRHSFDSQRATLSFGTDSNLSNRRNRAAQEESDRSKRRRPSQTRIGEQQPSTSNRGDVNLPTVAPPNPRHRFTLPTRLSLPILSRPKSPVTTPAPLELSYRRATSFSHRLALPAVFGTNAQASSTAFSTLSPIADSGNVLRPRPARVSPDPIQVRQRDDRRRRETLERAGQLLDAAEDTLRRTRPLLGLPGVPRDEPRVEAEGQFPTFPSIRHLPNPARPNDTPPIIGVRLGEGWNRRTTNSDPILHIPRSLFDPPTPARTPPPINDLVDDSQPSSSANRSFRSLNLSTLRNRRNQPPPLPPPEWSESVEIAEAERLNEMLSMRRSLQYGLERQELRAASNRRNPSMRVAESSATTEGERTSGDVRDGRETMLWGEVRQLPTNPRLRGPTERANERWRLHSTATTSTTPLAPLPADMRAPNAPLHRNLPRPSSSREGFQSFQHQMEYEDGPSIWRGSRSTPPALSTTPPPRASHDRSGDSEIPPFAQRATSPSPSRRRSASDRQRAQFIVPSASADSTRRDPVSLFSEESSGERRLRFRRRAAVGGVEDEEETTEARTWRPPPRPLRLPNAGSGRAIVFPHPAAVTGPVSGQSSAGERRAGDASASTAALEESGVGSSLQRSRSIAPPRRSIFDDDLESVRDADMRTTAHRRMTARIADRINSDSTLATLRRDRAELQDLLSSREGDAYSFLARSRMAAMESGRFGADSELLGGPFGGSRFFGDFLPWRNSLAFDSRNYLDDDEFDSSYEALVQLSERLGDVPKSRTKINTDKLKKFAYKEWPKLNREQPDAGPSTSAIPIDSMLAVRGVDKDERCAICLADYEEENEVMMGDCFHAFHRECLESWLTTNSSCPICRVSHL